MVQASCGLYMHCPIRPFLFSFLFFLFFFPFVFRLLILRNAIYCKHCRSTPILLSLDQSLLKKEKKFKKWWGLSHQPNKMGWNKSIVYNISHYLIWIYKDHYQSLSLSLSLRVFCSLFSFSKNNVTLIWIKFSFKLSLRKFL
jgi:hypothetical protein